MAYTSDSNPRPVEIIGHRGSPRIYRENTLASFLQAFDDGAVAVELDVHGTRDGIVVVHHDPATNSRSGDAGPVIAIADAGIESLREVLIGGSPIPTLSEVLAAVPERATVYVEVKAKDIELAVIAAIRSGQRSCAVHSFDHRVVQRVRALAPDIPVGVLQTSYPVDPIRPLLDVGARDLWQQWELVDEALVDGVHEAGGRVIAWTVNHEAVAERLIGWGVDGICSDTPAVMRKLADRLPSR
jgi:glycerophosphoryl diester phosphodiesterase